MGKLKRLRKKFHNAAQRSKASSEAPSKPCEDVDMMDSSDPMPPPPPPGGVGAAGDTGNDLFKNVNISSLDLVKQALPDFDARSTVTSKTLKGLNMTKKEKQKLRRNAWMAKIDHIKAAEKEAKDSKKKAHKLKGSVVGNLAPMLDALPTLELLMKSSPKQSDEPRNTKSRSTKTEKARKTQMVKDISLFKQVLKHPLFVEDEKRTITDHLKIAVEKKVV